MTHKTSNRVALPVEERVNDPFIGDHSAARRRRVSLDERSGLGYRRLIGCSTGDLGAARGMVPPSGSRRPA